MTGSGLECSGKTKTLPGPVSNKDKKDHFQISPVDLLKHNELHRITILTSIQLHQYLKTKKNWIFILNQEILDIKCKRNIKKLTMCVISLSY